MNTYANVSDNELLEIMDDHGVAHEVIHEAAKRLKKALGEREALEAVMRPDGHYLECPCRGSDDIWGQGHKHMPHNPTVAICKQLRAAIAPAE